MTIEVTEEMMTAVSVAIAEIGNSDIWADHVTDEEFEQTLKGRDEWDELLEEYYS